MTFLAKVRNYGWYCNKCMERKEIDKVKVVKVIRDKYIKTVCADCNTELMDCFVAKRYYPEIATQCNTCPDRFQCFTMSDAKTEKPLEKMAGHEIHPRCKVMDDLVTTGIKSYTGMVYDKLEPKDFCLYPDREDCNHSYMRADYSGEPYRRCHYMKYDTKKREWYCEYGKQIRGE